MPCNNLSNQIDDNKSSKLQCVQFFVNMRSSPSLKLLKNRVVDDSFPFENKNIFSAKNNNNENDVYLYNPFELMQK